MKKIFTKVIFILAISLNAQSINDDLLLHYPFTGNANDVSGNLFNGTVNATLTEGVLGDSYSAFSFNGTNEYIDFPNVSELKPELPLSFSFWVKFDDLQAQNTVIFTTDFAQNNHSGVWMNLSSTGLLALNYGDASGNTTSANRRTKVGTTQLKVNNWYHIVGVLSGATNMKIYIDCSDDNGSYQGSGGALGYTSNAGSIGRKDGHSALSAYYFKGSLDDFRYWNRELTSDDITFLCSSQSSNLSLETPKKVAEQVKVKSNPVEDVLKISVSASSEVENVTLYNVFGQETYKGSFKEEINVTHLKKGVYFLRVVYKDSRKANVVKFIKK